MLKYKSFYENAYLVNKADIGLTPIAWLWENNTNKLNVYYSVYVIVINEIWMCNSDRSTVWFRPEHGPVRSTKRKNGVGGWVACRLILISCSTTYAILSVLFLLYNQRPPMRGLASLKGNTLPVKNVINGLDQGRIFIYKCLCIAVIIRTEYHNTNDS